VGCFEAAILEADLLTGLLRYGASLFEVVAG
jgi:hypothetical protein